MAGPWEKYRQAAPPAAIPIGPQDPYRMPQAQADLAGKQVQTAAAQQGMAIDRQRLALDQSRTTLDVKRADLEMTKAQREAAEKERERRLAFAPMEAMEKQLRRTWDTFAEGPGSTEPNTPAALLDFNPYSKANSEFNAAAAGLGQQGMAAFRVPGAGTFTDADLAAFVAANQPAAGDTDATIKEKLMNIERRMGPMYSAYGREFKPYRPKGMIGSGKPAPAAPAPKASSAPSMQELIDEARRRGLAK